MAFATKTDLVGIATTGLELRSNGQNASNSVLQIPGEDGSILGDEVYGHIKAPNCEYAITSSITLDNIKLGKCYNSPYALNNIHVTTGAGQEPTVTATAVQVEPSATQTICTYAVDSLSLSPARHALNFGAFSYTQSPSLALQNCEFDATADISPATINGDPVASDSTGGVQTCAVTFWSSTETTAPSISLASDWHVTSDWTCVGADSSMFVWTATFTKYLTALQAS